jgi:hypothetical protein
MSRVQLFELQDLDAWPTSFGDAGTAYLRTIERAAGAPALLAPAVADALDQSGCDRMIDLCSGAGGPVVDIVDALRADGREVDLILSDIAPNRVALGSLAARGVKVHGSPVDAAAVPRELTGLRTIFNAFHHFDDALALRVLEDAVEARQPIAIFELSERSMATVVFSTFIPLLVWLVMPFVRPMRLSWLVFTYLIPILPLSIAWDGFVSHLRTRSPAELRALVAKLDAPGWSFTAERVKGSRGLAFTMLRGLPPRGEPRSR